MKSLVISMIILIIIVAADKLSIAEQEGKQHDLKLQKEPDTQREYKERQENEEQKKKERKVEEEDKISPQKLPDPCLKKPDLHQCDNLLL